MFFKVKNAISYLFLALPLASCSFFENGPIRPNTYQGDSAWADYYDELKKEQEKENSESGIFSSIFSFGENSDGDLSEYQSEKVADSSKEIKPMIKTEKISMPIIPIEKVSSDEFTSNLSNNLKLNQYKSSLQTNGKKISTRKGREYFSALGGICQPITQYGNTIINSKLNCRYQTGRNEEFRNFVTR